MSETFVQVPFDAPVPEGINHCAFVFIFGWEKLYEHYEDPSMTPERKNAFYPVVVLGMRWDGHLGAIGGKVDKGETAEEAVCRETDEEIAYELEIEDLRPLISHQSATMRLDAFMYDLGTSSLNNLRYLIADATEAEGAISELTPVIAHLCDYGNGQGWGNLRGSNMLSTMVAEELDALRKFMVENQPEGAIVAY